MVRQDFPAAKRLGSVKLFSANILQQPTGHDYGMDKSVTPVICFMVSPVDLVGEKNDSPSLKLAFASKVVPIKPPLRPNPLFPESIDKQFLAHLCSFADSDYAEALGLSDDNPDKARLLHDVGDIFKKRHTLLNNITDLMKANLAYEKAVDLTPDSDPHKPDDLNHLGNELWRLFRLRGDTANGDKSIEAFEKAVELTPDAHPNKPRRLGTLGDFYLTRFRNISDVEMAIRVFENAVSLTSEDSPQKPTFLHGLARSLFLHFDRFGDIADINKSVSAAEKSCSIGPRPKQPSTISRSFFG